MQSAARIICPPGTNKFHTCRLIPKPVKKLEKLFIAPKVRQVLYETSQRVFTRCACARRTGFLIKFLIKNQYEKNFRPGTRPGRKWIAFDLPPAGGKLCEAFGQSYKGPGVSLAPCMIVEVPEIVRKPYDFRIFNWTLCAFAGNVHGDRRDILQGNITGRSANVVENILPFV